jgi:hypothetical protein
MFSSTVERLFEHILADSTCLKQKVPTMIAKLQGQGRADTDGTGNKVTNHEAAFAQVLEQFGSDLQSQEFLQLVDSVSFRLTAG